MKLAALYCVKNEEEFLPFSVATVVPYVDEVVIINNRSTDRTMEVAGLLPDKRVNLEYNSIEEIRYKLVNIDSDFDEKCEFNMRNESLKHVSNDIDWLVVLDADQLLSDGWRDAIDPILKNPKAEAIAAIYVHLVGSYQHMDKGLYQRTAKGDTPITWAFFRRTPHLECRPASEVCGWAKPQHHASFERSCKSGSTFRCPGVSLFHYGFAKRNMMEMTLYRIHRGDYGHEDETKSRMSAELKSSGNPFSIVGPVHPVNYLPKQVPTVMRPLLDRYTLELDKDGNILKRTITATGELAQ
jgi:glycosyltransferase involved in cell wall biosynthesis